MLLRNHLIERGLNYSTGARDLTARFPDHPVSPQQMRSWCLPANHDDFDMPRPYRMRDLYVWSAGAVAPNDFYDLPALVDASADDAAPAVAAGQDGFAAQSGSRKAVRDTRVAAHRADLRRVNGHGGDA